jgi:hypothetical protein
MSSLSSGWERLSAAVWSRLPCLCLPSIFILLVPFCFVFWCSNEFSLASNSLLSFQLGSEKGRLYLKMEFILGLHNPISFSFLLNYLSLGVGFAQPFH